MIQSMREVQEIGQKPYTEVVTGTTTLSYSRIHQTLECGLRVMIEAQPPIAGLEGPHNDVGDDLYGEPGEMRLLRTDVRPNEKIGHYILEVSDKEGRPLAEVSEFLKRLETYVDDPKSRDRFRQIPSVRAQIELGRAVSLSRSISSSV